MTGADARASSPMRVHPHRHVAPAQGAVALLGDDPRAQLLAAQAHAAGPGAGRSCRRRSRRAAAARCRAPRADAAQERVGELRSGCRRRRRSRDPSRSRRGGRGCAAPPPPARRGGARSCRPAARGRPVRRRHARAAGRRGHTTRAWEVHDSRASNRVDRCVETVPNQTVQAGSRGAARCGSGGRLLARAGDVRVTAPRAGRPATMRPGVTRVARARSRPPRGCMSTSVPAGSPPDARVARVLARLSESARGAASPDAVFGAGCDALRDVLGPAYLPRSTSRARTACGSPPSAATPASSTPCPFGSGVYATAFTTGSSIADPLRTRRTTSATCRPIDRVEACLAVPFQAGRDAALLGLEVLEPVDEEVLARAGGDGRRARRARRRAARRGARGDDPDPPPGARLRGGRGRRRRADAPGAAARALGDLLELDVVQVALGRRGALGTPSAWRRTRRDDDLVLSRARFPRSPRASATGCRRGRRARPAVRSRSGRARAPGSACRSRAPRGWRATSSARRAAARRRWSSGSARR